VDQSAIEELKNLSGTSARMLKEAGITSPTELHELGAVEAYVRVKRAGVQAGVNLLYAIEGAIRDVSWTELPYNVLASLTLEADAYLADEGLH
jgi:DNA transformation protein